MIIFYLDLPCVGQSYANEYLPQVKKLGEGNIIHNIYLKYHIIKVEHY